MELKVLKNEKNMLEIEVPDVTIVNLIHEKIWENNGMSAYKKDHPYMSQPRLQVRGPKAKQDMLKAADSIIKQCKDLRKMVEHAK